jgi:hypothetical protein
MTLGSTQPLTGVFPGGKGGRCVRLTTLPPSCAVVMKSGNLNFLEPSGPLQACNGADCFTFLPPQYSTTCYSFNRTEHSRNVCTAQHSCGFSLLLMYCENSTNYTQNAIAVKCIPFSLQQCIETFSFRS